MRDRDRNGTGIRRLVCTVGAVVGVMVGSPVQAIDWNAVKEQEVMLFYPGQASWEWALTQSDHSGAQKFREGKDCFACHKGEEKDIGALIVSGKKLEPAPIPGKPGSLPLKVKTAHDGERLYFRFEWQAPKPTGGKKMDPEVAARVTVMFDDGGVREATRAGCWGTCHDDAVGMASAPPGKEISKYLVASRSRVTRQGGGENFKPPAELQQLLKQGVFMEYWQARLNPGQPAQAADGYVLDKRHKHPSPAASAQAQFDGGKWIVVLSRKLKAGGDGRKDIVPGKTYSLGFAVHENHADHRFHYVSFERTLVLDQGKADFVAVKR